MGIGAYQVREFIQGMGGKLSVSSEINVGTTVCITLPIKRGAVSEHATRRIIEDDNRAHIESLAMRNGQNPSSMESTEKTESTESTESTERKTSSRRG